MTPNQPRDLFDEISAFFATPVEQRDEKQQVDSQLDDVMSLGMDPALGFWERKLRCATVEEQAVMMLATLNGANNFEPPTGDEVAEMSQMIESIVCDGEVSPPDWPTNLTRRAIAASLICDADLVNRMFDSWEARRALFA